MVEMMVAVVIGLFLMSGAVSLLVTSKRTYLVQDDLGRIQENARFAMDMLARDLRMAGYFGCADNISQVFNHVNFGAGGSILDISDPIEGFEAGTAAWLPSASNEDVDLIRAGTDAITLRFIAPSGIKVTAAMPQPSAAIHTTTNSGLQQGDIIAVTDCESADIMQISGPSGTNPSSTGTVVHNTGTDTSPGNTSLLFPGCPGAAANCLSKIYDTDAEIMKLVAYRYFIGDDANGAPALFRTGLTVSGGTPTATGTPVQLIDGVEQMQITYGVDTTGDRVPDVYLAANGTSGAVDLNTAAGWDNVLSVRVGLLFRSVEETAPDVDTAVYTVNGAAVDPVDDRRRRRVFSTTIWFRNL